MVATACAPALRPICAVCWGAVPSIYLETTDVRYAQLIFAPLAFASSPARAGCVAAAAAAAMFLAYAAGCTTPAAMTAPEWQTHNVLYENPVLLSARDPHLVWENVVDVVDDYFRIRHEEPVRVVDQVITEGRLDTFPEIASTVFEPWRSDSVGRHAKWEATLHPIRHYAMVRVRPARGGFLIDVAVYKEQEELPRPEHASFNPATFRNDGSLTRVVGGSGQSETASAWVLQGRDTALEQKIIGEIAARCGRAVPCLGSR